MKQPESPPLNLDTLTGHTPGPWATFPCYPQGNLEIGRLEPHSNLLRLVCTVDESDPADARLIAAAPALLEECRRQRAEIARLSTRLAAAESLIYDAYEDCSDDDEVRALIEQREKDEAARAALQQTGEGA